MSASAARKTTKKSASVAKSAPEPPAVMAPPPMKTFMNYKKIPITGGVEFNVNLVDPAVLNGLRRAILSDIDIVGFSAEEDPSFQILANNGPLHNEFIQHRLGLLPVHMSAAQIAEYEKGDYEFELNVENTGREMINVTTADFKITDVKNKRIVAVDEIFPPSVFPGGERGYILITRLRPGEKLHVKGTPVKRAASFHAGFSAVSQCVCIPVPGAGENLLEQQRNYAKNEHGDATNFVFKIEPVAGMSVKELVLAGIDVLQRKLSAVDEKLNIEESKQAGYNFVFTGEDDTLGYLLQSHIFRNYCRGGEDRLVKYVGYTCPHPLDTSMVLCLALSQEDATAADTKSFLLRAVGEISQSLSELRDKWNTFTSSV